MNIRHTTVLVVDDHEVVASALCSLLELQPDFEVVGVATNGLESEALARELCPDVVLMDLAMPELGGIEAARRILEQQPDCKIVFLSMHSDIEHVQQAMRVGAAGYVLKRSAARETIAAIRAVRSGERYLAPQLAAELARRLCGGDAEDPFTLLSGREREVLTLLAQSHSVQAIAERLGLSPKTVETYRTRLMDKLDIRDLPGLVRFAVRRGLVDLN